MGREAPTLLSQEPDKNSGGCGVLTDQYIPFALGLSLIFRLRQKNSLEKPERLVKRELRFLCSLALLLASLLLPSL